MRTFDTKVDSILKFTAEKLAEMETNRRWVKTLLGATQVSTTAQTITFDEKPTNFKFIAVRVNTSAAARTYTIVSSNFLGKFNNNYISTILDGRTGDTASRWITINPTSDTSCRIALSGTATGTTYVSIYGVERVANS